MEITIKTTCPHCNKEIAIESKTNTLSQNHEEPKKKESMLPFYFGRRCSAPDKYEKANSDWLLKDFVDSVERSKNQTAVNIIKDRFSKMANKVRLTKDPRELLELSRYVIKMRVKVSKRVLRELEKDKKELLKMIKEKVKVLKR
jgi:hypothetical protein